MSVTFRGQAKFEAAQASLTIPNVTIATGSVLLISLGLKDHDIDFFPTSVKWGTQDMSLQAGVITTAGAVLPYTLLIATGGTHDVVLDFSGPQPQSVCLALAHEMVGPNTGNFSGNGNTGLPAVGTSASIPIGSLLSTDAYITHYMMVTRGPTTDTPGTWENGFLARNRIGSTTLAPAEENVTLDVAFYTTQNETSETRSVVGFTSRTYFGAGSGYRLPLVVTGTTTYDTGWANYNAEWGGAPDPAVQQRRWVGNRRFDGVQ